MTVVVVIALFAAVQVLAGTLHVEKWGDDNATCGAASDPCLSISQAIYNANANSTIQVGPGFYGDLNGDGDVTDAGEENAAGHNNCGFASAVVCIDKPGLKLESTLGARATHITAEGGAYRRVVYITAGKVRFGKKNKGFTVEENGHDSGKPGRGVEFRGQNIVIEAIVSSGNDGEGFYSSAYLFSQTGNQLRYNRAVNNGGSGYYLTNNSGSLISHVTRFEDNTAEGNGSVGIYLYSQERVTVRRNKALRNGAAGIYIPSVGAGTTIQDNLAQGNGLAGLSVLLAHGETGIRVENNLAIGNGDLGIGITGPGKKIKNNVCIGNVYGGFHLTGHNPAFQDEFSGNLATTNQQAGVWLHEDFNTVSNFKFQKNNIYGNDLAGGLNRGVVNETGTEIYLRKNFWGAASGPGADPADNVRDDGANSVTHTSPAKKPNKIKTKIGGF